MGGGKDLKKIIVVIALFAILFPVYTFAGNSFVDHTVTSDSVSFDSKGNPSGGGGIQIGNVKGSAPKKRKKSERVVINPEELSGEGGSGDDLLGLIAPVDGIIEFDIPEPSE
jgi:hypothetical protein